MENKEKNIDIIELAKEMNAVVVLDERIKNKDKKLAEKVKNHNNTIKTKNKHQEKYNEVDIVDALQSDLGDDEEEYDYIDVDEKQDADMWPMNVISEIYGDCANREFANRLKSVILNDKRFEEEMEKVLDNLEDAERKIVYDYYKDCFSLREIAERENKDVNEIISLKEYVLRRLRFPTRIKELTKIYGVEIQKLEDEFLGKSNKPKN